MIIDGITLVEGSYAHNLTIATGYSADQAALTPSSGEMFYRLDLNELQVYINAAWDGVATATGLSGKVSKAGDTMTGQLILPVNGLIVGTTQFTTTNGGIGFGTGSPSSQIHLNEIQISTAVYMKTTAASSTLGLDVGIGADGNAYITHRDNFGLILGANNANALTISSANYIGIGAAPTYQLDVQSANAVVARFKTTALGSSQIQQENSTSGIINSLGTDSVSAVGWIGMISNHKLEIRTNNSARMIVDTTGYVGFGVTPVRNVSISGAGPTYLQLTNTTIGETAGRGLEFSTAIDGTASIINNENASLKITVNAADRVVIDPAGNVFVGGTTQATAQSPVYSANTPKCWVVFNGSTTPPTILASYNVSGVVKNSTGDYTVTMTNAMQSANYAVMCSTADIVNYLKAAGPKDASFTTTTFGVISHTTDTGAAVDSGYIAVTVYGL